MSIVVGLVTLGGIALASDSRRILVDPGKENNLGEDFEIAGDNFPKTHLLCNRYALNYTGISRLPNEWSLEKDELPKLETMLGKEGFSIRKAAATLNERLSDILCVMEREKAFNFSLCGYEKGTLFPYLVRYSNGMKDLELGLLDSENGDFLGGISCAGYVDNINEFISNKQFKCTTMSIRDALDLVELLVNLEISSRKYCHGQREYCGGKINLAAITVDQCGFIGRLPTGEIYIIEDKPRVTPFDDILKEIQELKKKVDSV